MPEIDEDVMQCLRDGLLAGRAMASLERQYGVGKETIQELRHELGLGRRRPMKRPYKTPPLRFRRRIPKAGHDSRI